MTDYFKIVTIFFLLSTNVVSANLNIEARTAILIDYQSGKVLYELEADHSIHPASMTKIMTSIIVFDLLDKKTVEEIIKNFSKNKKCEVITLSTFNKDSVTKIKAKLLNYAS